MKPYINLSSGANPLVSLQNEDAGVLGTYDISLSNPENINLINNIEVINLYPNLKKYASFGSAIVYSEGYNYSSSTQVLLPPPDKQGGIQATAVAIKGLTKDSFTLDGGKNLVPGDYLFLKSNNSTKDCIIKITHIDQVDGSVKNWRIVDPGENFTNDELSSLSIIDPYEDFDNQGVPINPENLPTISAVHNDKFCIVKIEFTNYGTGYLLYTNESLPNFNKIPFQFINYGTGVNSVAYATFIPGLINDVFTTVESAFDSTPINSDSIFDPNDYVKLDVMDILYKTYDVNMPVVDHISYDLAQSSSSQSSQSSQSSSESSSSSSDSLSSSSLSSSESSSSSSDSLSSSSLSSSISSSESSSNSSSSSSNQSSDSLSLLWLPSLVLAGAAGTYGVIRWAAQKDAAELAVKTNRKKLLERLTALSINGIEDKLDNMTIRFIKAIDKISIRSFLNFSIDTEKFIKHMAPLIKILAETKSGKIVKVLLSKLLEDQPSIKLSGRMLRIYSRRFVRAATKKLLLALIKEVDEPNVFIRLALVKRLQKAIAEQLKLLTDEKLDELIIKYTKLKDPEAVENLRKIKNARRAYRLGWKIALEYLEEIRLAGVKERDAIDNLQDLVVSAPQELGQSNVSVSKSETSKMVGDAMRAEDAMVIDTEAHSCIFSPDTGEVTLKPNTPAEILDESNVIPGATKPATATPLTDLEQANIVTKAETAAAVEDAVKTANKTVKLPILTAQQIAAEIAAGGKKVQFQGLTVIVSKSGETVGIIKGFGRAVGKLVKNTIGPAIFIGVWLTKFAYAGEWTGDSYLKTNIETCRLLGDYDPNDTTWFWRVEHTAIQSMYHELQTALNWVDIDSTVSEEDSIKIINNIVNFYYVSNSNELSPVDKAQLIELLIADYTRAKAADIPEYTKKVIEHLRSLARNLRKTGTTSGTRFTTDEEAQQIDEAVSYFYKYSGESDLDIRHQKYVEALDRFQKENGDYEPDALYGSPLGVIIKPEALNNNSLFNLLLNQ